MQEYDFKVPYAGDPAEALDVEPHSPRRASRGRCPCPHDQSRSYARTLAEVLHNKPLDLTPEKAVKIRDYNHSSRVVGYVPVSRGAGELSR